MSEVSFERFIQLVEFDQATLKLEKECTGIQREIDHAHDAMKKIAEQIQEADNKLKRAKLLVKEKEAYIEDLTQRQKEKEKQLDKVKSQREYAPITAEIDSLKKAQHQFEPELIDAWNALEGATREVKLSQSQREQEQATTQSFIDQKESKLSEMRLTCDQREKEREALLVGVPPELLEKYNAMRTRVTNPIVPVVNNSCSACFNTVAQQLLSKLRMRVLEQCRGCFRFLYVSDHR